MDRAELDRFSRAHRLSAAANRAALDLTGNRPAADAWRGFAQRLLDAAGLAGVGAGLIFFVAANWQAWGLTGRFALLEAGLALCVAVALWRPAPAPAGRAALLLAVLFSGALLALFGQSYQTGADVDELFFAWAALALPFALAARSGAVWALWWAALDAGLLLRFGTPDLNRVAWRLAGWEVDRATPWLLPCTVNLAAAGAFFALRATRFGAAAPRWLARSLLAVGLGCGTFAAVLAIVGPPSARGSIALPLYAALSVAVAIGAWRVWRDLFALALLAGSWIVVSTSWWLQHWHPGGLAMPFLMALWLIVASTATAWLLNRLSAHWQPDQGALR